MNRIKQLREEKNITQTRLSIELEVSQETISAYEKEKYFPSVKSLVRLSNIFGVSIDYILGLSDNKYSSFSTDSLCEDEIYIIQLYRKMDTVNRKYICAYLEGYLSALQIPNN